MDYRNSPGPTPMPPHLLTGFPGKFEYLKLAIDCQKSGQLLVQGASFLASGPMAQLRVGVYWAEGGPENEEKVKGQSPLQVQHTLQVLAQVAHG